MKYSIFLVFLSILPFSISAQSTSLISTSTSPICVFNRNLQLGFKGEDVRNLQTILNRNSQTLITKTGAGSPQNETTYFGLATRAAVIKFQELYAEDILIPSKLSKGNGFVRAFTIQKLKNLCQPTSINAETVPSVFSTSTTSAPNATTTVIKEVVAQIFIGGGGDSSSTSVYDFIPPTISSIVATPVSDTSMTITWMTDEVSNSLVEYGTSSAYTASSTFNATLTTSHSVTLTGLTASTTYHFRVQSADVSGNIRNSTDQTLVTFVGLLDSYGNMYAVHAAKRVITSYVGPLYRIRRDSDNATMDVTPTATGWPNISTISTWLGGASAFVTIVYDQTGNARNIAQVSTIKQPSLNISGTQAVFEFDGVNQDLAGSSTMSTFAQNINAASIISVRRHNSSAVADRVPVFVSNSTGATRMTMGLSATLGTDSASGRRLDADTVQRTNGFAINTNWATEIGRWDWATANLFHQRDGESEIRTPFQTTGSTSNTVSGAVTVGGAVNGSYFKGELSLVAWVQAKLTDSQVGMMVTTLADLKATTTLSTSPQFLSWGSASTTGTYTLAPSLTNYTVLAPNGLTPSAADLDSHRYHHHTRVGVNNGRVWVAFSSSGTNEDAGGQLTVVKSTTNGGSTWSTTTIAVPSQSTFSGTGAAYEVGTRVTYPRSFVSYNGDLYLVSAVDDTVGANSSVGTALVANKMNDDGTVGALFRVSSESYTPKSGFPAVDYDATLGPTLFASASLYGPWGGSGPGNTPSSWPGWITQNGEDFAEPTTFALNASSSSLVRLWRKVTTAASVNTLLWSQRSYNGGTTWTSLGQTNIPNSPSATAGLRLSDGRIVLVGNPRDSGVVRDPLYVALFDGTTGNLNNVYAVRQGLSGTPTYAGTYKGGGAQYPGIAFDGTNLWVSYSIAKESVGVTKIPLSGL